MNQNLKTFLLAVAHFWKEVLGAGVVLVAAFVVLVNSFDVPAPPPVDPPVVVDPPPTPVPNTSWQAYVAARAARPDAYADSGQWDCLMFEATGDAAHAQAAIAQALGNWPDLNRNNTREHGQFAAIMYMKLKAHMTAEQKSEWETHLRTWAEFMLHVDREGDSDEIVGHYLGLRMTDKALGSTYGLRADKGLVSPATMRGIITDYVARAKGGEWIESSMYNLGTVSLLLLGVEQLGPEEFPEVIAWLPELAETMVWSVTADGHDTTQWGDEQNPHDEKLYAFVALACQVIDLGGDKTGKLADLVALRIKDRPVEDYGFSLYRPLWAGFDPDTLPANPTWPNPQGLRTTNVGLVIYRKGNVLVQVFCPNELGVDHRIDGTNIRLYDGGWPVDAPIGYDNVRPLNQAVGFGFSAMAARQLIGAEETAGGFKAVWSTGGDLRGSWAGNNQPRHFVEEMTMTIEYTHEPWSFRIVDDFKGHEPDFTATGGPAFSPIELATIKGAPARWQRVQHTPNEPTATADGFTWKDKTGRTIVLKTTATKRTVEKCSTVNMRGDFHPQELEGWLIRLMSDELPVARIETTVGPLSP